MDRYRETAWRPTLRLPRWLLLLPALVLVLGLAAGVAHHHAGEDASHPCATCALSHASAAPILVASPTPPTSHGESVLQCPDLVLVSVARSTTSSRAPPAL